VRLRSSDVGLSRFGIWMAGFTEAVNAVFHVRPPARVFNVRPLGVTEDFRLPAPGKEPWDRFLPFHRLRKASALDRLLPFPRCPPLDADLSSDLFFGTAASWPMVRARGLAILY